MSNSNELLLHIKNIAVENLEKDQDSILQKIDKESTHNLQEYILNHLQTLDGGPTINNLQIENLAYDPINEKGKFRLKFQIDRRYCCSDIESCSNDYLDFEFEYQKGNIRARTEYFDWTITN